MSFKIKRSINLSSYKKYVWYFGAFQLISNFVWTYSYGKGRTFWFTWFSLSNMLLSFLLNLIF